MAKVMDTSKVMHSSSSQKLPPSTSRKDTSNFKDHKLNEVKFHHKKVVDVDGTDLGRPVDGIAMKIVGGVGFAYTGSEEEGWTLTETFISFADAKRYFGKAEGFQGVAFAIGN